MEGPAKDLHSGVFGGTVHEPMTDLIFLMNSLVKPDGEILIPGIMDQVALLDAQESSLYKDIAFSMTELYDAIGSTTALFPDEKNTLMHRYVALGRLLTKDGVILPFLSMESKVLSQHQVQRQSSRHV